MDVLYRIGETYLNLLTPIENGGVAVIVLNNIEFTENIIDIFKIKSPDLWTTYIRQLLFNVSRLKPIVRNHSYQFYNSTTVSNPNCGTTIMMIFWLISFLFMTFVLIVIMIKLCVKDYRARKINHNEVPMEQLLSSSQKTNASNIHKVASRKSVKSFSHLRPHKRRNKILILVTMMSMIILWIIFMILLCIAQYLLSAKLTSNSINTTENSTLSYDSIQGAVSQSFKYLNNFIDIVTNQTSVFLSVRLSAISTNVKNHLLVSLVSFVHEVLDTFNITSLFNTSKTLIDSINDVVINMNFININSQHILEEVDKLKGSVNVYQSYLRSYLNNICPSISNKKLFDNCHTLLGKVALFQVDIQTTAVSSSSSVIMLFVLQQYNINITNIANTFRQVNSTFQTSLNLLFNSTINNIDTTTYITTIQTAWNQIVATIVPSFTNLSTYNAMINSYVNIASNYENYVIIIIFLLLIMTFVILITSFRDSITRKFLNSCLNFFVQLSFIIVLILSSAVCIAILVASNISKSEICNQINTTTGIQVLDQMIDDKLTIPWNSLKRSLSSSSASSHHIGINLVQPTNILSGINYRCRNTSTGLMSVLGMGNIVNVSQFVQMQSIKSLISTAKIDALKAFLGVNPRQMIPQDIISFVSQTSTLIAYFDGINYKIGIKELTKPLVGIPDFVGFFDDLSQFVMAAAESIGWSPELKYLKETVDRLHGFSPNLTNLQQNITNIAAAFQTLQNHQNNKVFLNQLVTIITNVQNLFNNSALLTSMFSSIYDRRIGTDLVATLKQLLSDSIGSIIYQILPCRDLSYIFEAMTTTICSNSNFNVALATLGIFLLIAIIICQLMSIIVMISISLKLNIE